MPAAPTAEPIRLHAGDTEPLRYATRIAGCEVRTSVALEGFQPAEITAAHPRRWPAFAGDARVTTGFIADRVRRISTVFDEGCLRIEFEGLGGLQVDLDAGVAVVDPGLSEAVTRDILLGPGLLLPLAMRGVYALHASAIGVGGRPYLLAAPSGSGKSSLARAAGDDGHDRLADDVSPIEVGQRIRLRPRFPQLKWSSPLGVPDLDLDIAGIVFVERGASTLALSALEPAQARLNLIRDTVAARLFPPLLLARHLDAVTRLAGALPMLRLGWPDCAATDVADQCRRALDLLAGTG